MSAPVENIPLNNCTPVISRNSSFLISPTLAGTPVTQNSKLLDFWNLVIAEEDASWQSLYINIAIYLEVDLEKLDTAKLRKRLDPAGSLATPTLSKLALAIKESTPEVYFQKFVILDVAEETARVDKKPVAKIDANEKKASNPKLATPVIAKSGGDVKKSQAPPVDKVKKPVEPAFVAQGTKALLNDVKKEAHKPDVDNTLNVEKATKPVNAERKESLKSSLVAGLSLDLLFPGLSAEPIQLKMPVNDSPSPALPARDASKRKSFFPIHNRKQTPPRADPPLPDKTLEKPVIKTVIGPDPIPAEDSPILNALLDHFSKTKALAEKGHVQSMCQLASYYMTGKYTPQDPKSALEWYSKGSDLQDPEALNSLAMFYLKGIEVDKDIYKAVDLYSRAASSGSPSGMYNLAMCFRDGIGFDKDEVKAVNWFRKASDLGNVAAMNRLGMCYQIGSGVKPDPQKAFQMYILASQNDNHKAYLNLGVCYEEGIGTEKDVKKAFEYFLKSAEKGNSKAQFRLGELYEKGIGTIKDKELAKEW